MYKFIYPNSQQVNSVNDVCKEIDHIMAEYDLRIDAEISKMVKVNRTKA